MFPLTYEEKYEIHRQNKTLFENKKKEERHAQDETVRRLKKNNDYLLKQISDAKKKNELLSPEVQEKIKEVLINFNNQMSEFYNTEVRHLLFGLNYTMVIDKMNKEHLSLDNDAIAERLLEEYQKSPMYKLDLFRTELTNIPSNVLSECMRCTKNTVYGAANAAKSIAATTSEHMNRFILTDAQKVRNARNEAITAQDQHTQEQQRQADLDDPEFKIFLVPTNGTKTRTLSVRNRTTFGDIETMILDKLGHDNENINLSVLNFYNGSIIINKNENVNRTVGEMGIRENARIYFDTQRLKNEGGGKPKKCTKNVQKINE